MTEDAVTPAPLILVAEDEHKLARVLLDYLRQAGLRAEHVESGAAVLPFLERTPVDLLLLDVMLPGRDGLQVLRAVRDRGPLPVILLTARVEEIDRLLGFELGADDYICKPFSPREVVARVKAVLKRSRGEGQATEPAPPESEDRAVAKAPAPRFSIDAARWRITVAGQALDLTPGEFRLLQALLGRPGQVFTRGQLLSVLHDDDCHVVDRTIDTHVKNLRKKLAEVLPGEPIIRSIYGVGYKAELP